MASLAKFDGLELPASADVFSFHVHLRDGAMMETVVLSVPKGGVIGVNR